MTNSISVIIPVYNVEDYLQKCLENILSWNFKNWEVILIDDGSYDNSGNICDEYANKDARIHVIHQKNMGVSSARNTGLDNANGDWIMFIDADDWLDGNTLFKELENINLDNIQAVIFGTSEDYGNNSFVTLPKACNYKIDENTDIIPYYGSLGFINLIYRNELIKLLRLRFSTNMKIGEDMEFMMKYHIAVNNIISIVKPIYHYVRREGSATQNPKYQRQAALDHILLLRNSLSWAKSYNKPLPKWFCECLRHNIRTGLRMAYFAKLSLREYQMIRRHLKEIDVQWRKFGYNLFGTPYLRLAKTNIFLYLILLRFKYKK